MGYADQTNLYAYVANDPMNNIDPTGMYDCSASDADRCIDLSPFSKEVKKDPNEESGSFNSRNKGCSGKMCRSHKNLDADTVASASEDFVENYMEMRAANTIGADKYFHCKANCEAAQRGSIGETTAEIIRVMQESYQTNCKAILFQQARTTREQTDLEDSKEHYIPEGAVNYYADRLDQQA